MIGRPLVLFLLVGFVGPLASTGCSDAPVDGSLRIEILSPPIRDPLADAVFLRLRVDTHGGGVRGGGTPPRSTVSRTWVLEPGVAIDVGFPVAADGALHQLVVEGLDASEQPTSRGTSPPVRFDEGADLVMRVVARPIGELSLTRQPLDQPRVDFGAALLPGGDVLIAGGVIGDVGTDTVERVDPWLTAITPGPSLPGPRVEPVLVASEDGTAILAGGGDELLLLREVDGEWESAGAGPEAARRSARIGPDRWALVGDAQTWTLEWNGDQASVQGGPTLQAPRSRPAVVGIGDGVLACGGGAGPLCEWIGGQPTDGPTADEVAAAAFGAGAIVLADTTLYLITSTTARVVGDLPVSRRLGTLDVLADGRLLIIGGEGDAAETADVLAPDHSDAFAVAKTVPLSVSRREHRTVALPGQTILAIGGLSAVGSFVPRGDVFVP